MPQLTADDKRDIVSALTELAVFKTQEAKEFNSPRILANIEKEIKELDVLKNKVETA